MGCRKENAKDGGKRFVSNIVQYNSVMHRLRQHAYVQFVAIGYTKVKKYIIILMK